MPDYKVNQMLDEINNLDGMDMTLSYASISKGQIPKEILPDEIKSIFQSDKYQMIIISSKYELATNELNDQVEKVKEIVKRYDSNALLAGEGPLMTDLVEISDHDFNSVNSSSIGRKEGKDKKEAVSEALGTSISSIVVSALCFFGATFGVGAYSKIEMISSLCTLMSRGAIISMVTVVTVLPAFLLVFDKLICKTTIGMKNENKVN